MKQLRDLPRLVAAAAPGSSASLTVSRNGQSSEIRTTVGEAPANPRVASSSDEQSVEPSGEDQANALGVHFAALTNELRRDLRIGRDAQGVVIAGIDHGSVAETLGLSRGDVVESINQQPVRSPAEAAQQLTEIANSPKKTALLLLNRYGVTQYVGVKLSKDEG